MKHVDDRTNEDKLTHRHLIGAYDTFLSGWGEARGGLSACAWTCKPEHVEQVKKWVESRSDMRSVEQYRDTFRPSSASHVHIYI